MDLFKGHTLEKNANGYTLVLQINKNHTEFAQEIFDFDKDEKPKLIDKIEDYIKDKFDNIKISAVKLVVGSLVVGTFVLGGPGMKMLEPVKAIQSNIPSSYKVQHGDTLWKISQKFGISISSIKSLNNLTSDTIYVGQELKLQENKYYTVKSGDTLWNIANTFGISVSNLKALNNLTSNTIYPGQKLNVKPVSSETTYTVVPGDTLWKIANNYGVSVDSIKNANNLSSNTIYINQRLIIPTTKRPSGGYNETRNTEPDWPAVTYIVQPGDTVSGVAAKFNTTGDNILKYNYMEPGEWLNAGDKIAISGYAPRVDTVTPGEAAAPARTGKLVDWFTEGQYLIKRGDTFTVVDVDTGRQFTATMIGGYNHSDIEPVSAADAQVMRELFGSWKWSPRSIVVYIDGINIAASLSGMPHGVDTVGNNSVSGHFDMYLKNSTSHGSASTSYINMHKDMVLKASQSR